MTSAYDALIEKDEKELEELLKEQGVKPEEDPEGVIIEDIDGEKPEKKVEEEPKGEEEKPEVVEPAPEPEDPEEKTFKKRYGDLRTHAQKQKKDFEKKISDLTSRIKGLEDSGAVPAGNVEIQIPEDAAALEEWRKDNPEAASIFENLAKDIAKKEISRLEGTVEQLQKDNSDTTMEKMLLAVSSKHPDFDEIKGEDEFHEWVEEQPKWVDTTVYESSDSASMIQVLDLYKLAKNRKTEPQKKANTKKEENKSAASNVKVTSAKPEIKDDTSGNIKESWVEGLDLSEYAKNEDKIMEAMRTGKFVYDLTGGAR